MATYTEYLWGSTTATYPTSVLTKRWTTTNETAVQCIADSDGQGGYIFEQEWSATARRLNSLDAIDGDANRDNIELLCRFRLTTTTRVDYEFGLVGRASGSAGSENSYEAQLIEGDTNDLGIRFRRMGSGTAFAITPESGDILYDVGTEWLWLRFRINSSDLKAKLWRDGEPEPSAWSVEATDSNLTGVGWGGLWGYSANDRTDVDYLSIGTNGDTAPLSSGTATIRTTAVRANVLSQDTGTPIRTSTVRANVLSQDTGTPIRTSSVRAFVLYSIPPPATVTQQVAELAVQQDTVDARSTQQVVELLLPQPKIPSLTLQAAEVAVQQDTNEARSTQQVMEVLYKTSALNVYITKQTAEVAVQKTSGVFTRNTQQVVEVLMAPPTADPAYDNFDAQPISVMV